MATLNFKGKAFVQNYHLQVKYHQLISRKQKSLTDKVSLHDNLIIHGDNLKVLKALLPTYAGKIKCIYIDPPYNTGNEKWVYNDNVTSPMMQDWLGKVVDRDDLTRHDKWLCMMMPRLKLLYELLHDTGVIFISIDDNEVHNLRNLMQDEIFGENNFVGTIIWRKKEGGGQTDDYFVTEHEYILVFAKTKQYEWIDEVIPPNEALFNKTDENGKFDAIKLAKWGSGARREDRPKMYFPITSPDGKKIYPQTPDGQEGRWRVGSKRMLLLVESELIHWEKKNGNWVPYEKKYFEDAPNKVIKERSILFDLANTADASNELKDIFGIKDVFDNPKPTELIKFLIAHSTDKDSIVLDSFAGSGTTGHAVLDLNKEDDGNRRFILIQLSEKIREDKPAYKLGFRDIVEITVERIRRVIKGMPDAKDEILHKGIGGSFSFFELGKPIELESILSSKNLPYYKDLARYVFYTATGEEFDESALDEEHHFIGESKNYKVYLFYQPNLEYLKNTPLNLERAKALGKCKSGDKKRLVFAPHKYLDHDYLNELRIDYAQLPFEIYKLAK